MSGDFLEDQLFYDRMSQTADTLHLSVDELIYGLTTEQLSQTLITQVFIFGMSVALYEKLIREVKLVPAAVAGHSLGEYSALVASGVLSFEQGLHIVKRRGELMDIANQDQSYAMVAISGVSKSDLHEICRKAERKTGGHVVIANENSSIQMVLSGDEPTADEAIKLSYAANALKVSKLQVKGAFHSSYMKEAAMEFTHFLLEQEQSFKQPEITIVMNRTGSACEERGDILKNLSTQMENPVRWRQTVDTLKEQAPSVVLEVGPGKTLSGLIKQNDRKINTQTLGTTKDYKRFLRHFHREEIS